MSEKRTPSAEEIAAQDEISKTKSKTLPILIWWLIVVVAVIALECWKHYGDPAAVASNDLSTFVYFGGVMTFAYMSLEYASDFFKNRQLPQGIGKVSNINRFKKIVYFWNILMTIAIGAYYTFNFKLIPVMDIVTVAGSLTVTFISGNKTNKIAQTV